MISFLYISAQILGTIAFGFQIFSARSKERNKLTLFLGLSNIFWVAHYVALGVPLAAIIAALIAVQLIVSSVVNQRYRNPIIVFFILLYWIAAYFTFENPLHLLPAVGASVVSVSFLLSRSLTQLLPALGTSVLSLTLLSRDSAMAVRIGAMTSFSMWMMHGFVTGSIVEIAANGIPLATAFYGLLAYDIGMKLPSWVPFARGAKTLPGNDK